MGSMHLLPPYYSTTNTKRRKKKKKSKSLLEAERQHAKFLKKMGAGGRSSVGRAGALQASGQEFDSPRLHQLKSAAIPLSDDIPVGVAPKKEVIPHNFTIAPAYNKGPYQVISKNDIKDIGK